MLHVFAKLNSRENFRVYSNYNVSYLPVVLTELDLTLICSSAKMISGIQSIPERIFEINDSDKSR